MSVFVTGDIHGKFFSLLRVKEHPSLKEEELTKEDFLIVCGDFGIWHNTEKEFSELNELAKENFNICFVDGNHENFDRLYSDEFEIVEFHGGRAHKIRDNIYHLMRGYIFDFCGKSFFCFGGASSHDIQDGILDIKDFESKEELFNKASFMRFFGQRVRINHQSWWKEELPSQEEMDFGWNNLKNHNFKVDYIITHCAPQNIASFMSCGKYEKDSLTEYFDKVMHRVSFSKWFFGHYHMSEKIFDNFQVLYKEFFRVC